MGVVNYDTVDGVILGDSVNGTYLRDALGSVTATIPNKVVANTYRYKPYGSQLAKTGGSPDPKFQWVGTAGYRQSSISHSASYVRSRHYGQEEGRWTTVDPLWPFEHCYLYTTSSPINYSDRSGSAPYVTPNCCINNLPGIVRNGRCERVSANQFDPRDNRKRCYFARCRMCSADAINHGRGNGGEGSFDIIVDTIISQLTGYDGIVGMAKCGEILSCIHRCPDSVSKKNGCHTMGGHHIVGPFFGFGCCIQAAIDLCCLFHDKVDFANGDACRPDKCAKGGGSGIPGLNTGDMERNWDDPIYIGPGMGSTEGCLDALIRAVTDGSNPINLGRPV